MKTSFIFVCQQGQLESKALLLAASLKQYLQGDYELIAAVPHAFELLQTQTRILLKTWGIRIALIQNPLAADYPIGNKLACLAIDTDADWQVFLDSDVLCLSRFKADDFFKKPALYAKVADVFTLGEAIDWHYIYTKFGLAMPSRRFRASINGKLMLPYFNAGFLAIPSHWSLAEKWIDCAKRIDSDSDIPNKRPWLDQMALPLALALGKYDYHSLDQRFNYPVHLKPLTHNNSVFFSHYHDPDIIAREPRLQQSVNQLLTKYPLLKQQIQTDNDWHDVFYGYQNRDKKGLFNRKKNQPYLREMIITGIPRSGTSYLCQQLHKIKNCVAINEPLEIFEPLQQIQPWGIPIYYQQLRQAVLLGKTIDNKMQNGQLIADTAVLDQRQGYQPKVNDRHFLLCTKNTLSYISRLTALQQVMPDTPIIACVRHPLDTIASWKQSFPHLAAAKVQDFPIGHPQDPHLSAWQQQQLTQIQAEDNTVIRRALLWDYLAQSLLQQPQVYILAYERLVTQPQQQLKLIIQLLKQPLALKFTEKIKASTVRHKREQLSSEDYQAITDICAESALALGYDLTI